MRNIRNAIYTAALLLALALAASSCNKPPAGDQAAAPNTQTSSAADTETKSQEQSVIYTCPMHSQVQQDKPGKCPICGMDLVKKA